MLPLGQNNLTSWNILYLTEKGKIESYADFESSFYKTTQLQQSGPWKTWCIERFEAQSTLLQMIAAGLLLLCSKGEGTGKWCVLIQLQIDTDGTFFIQNDANCNGVHISSVYRTTADLSTEKKSGQTDHRFLS